MVLTRNLENRWLRRYKFFFICGVLILLTQILLAVRFFALSGDNSNANVFVPHKISLKDENKKSGLIIDDEDASNVFFQRSSTQKALKTNNKTHLQLDELEFVPACKITAKEAISAIHRAKTQRCKQEIVNVTCLIKQGLLYPKSLPSFCPNNDLESGKSLGCFKDEKNFRLLSGYYGNNKNDNSPEFCIRLCLQSGFVYAGVQYSTECFCGNDEPPSTARLPDSSCNMKCPSDTHLACGGYFTINIYQTGIRKFVPQIAATADSPTERPVKIVFLLTLNGRALRQVKRLIKILYHKDHYYYIHVDIRQDYLFRELLPLERQFPNIRLTRNRFATIWGGASLLQMLLSTFYELLHFTGWKFDFVLNLSESDYPVKTVARLTDFLSANRDRNFVKSHGREVQRFIQKQGLDKTFVECDAHMWRTGDRKLPWNVQIDGGSDWVALSRKFIEYITKNDTDELVKGLLVVFKHTLLPAESFFHTVIRNSRFCNTYVDNNLHVTNWKRKLGCKCQYKHVVDWCGCSPNDFKPDDWTRIQNTESRQLFFARKFEPIVNQAVILQLERWLYGNDVLKDVVNLNSYWHNIYSSLDLNSADDALLTLTNSAVRVRSKSLFNKCELKTEKVLEVTSFHREDDYKKTLVRYLANVTNHTQVQMEIGVRPFTKLKTLKQSEITHRLLNLLVSSEYDQKEQIVRNFARFLGPYSEPVLLYQFASKTPQSAVNTNYTITFLWIDSAGRLAEVNNVLVDENSVIAHVKPVLKQPHLPGSWTVKLVYNNALQAETKFLITPLEYFGGNLITQSQAEFIHFTSKPYKEFEVSFEKFLLPISDRGSLEKLSILNSKKSEGDLQEWIDALLRGFYFFEGECVVGNIPDSCRVKLGKCNETDWSSLAPDPKSFIGEINRTTGKFDPW